MCKRLQLPKARVRVVFNGINLEGFSPAPPLAIRDPSSPLPRERETVAKPGEGAQARALNPQSAIRNPQSEIPNPPFPTLGYFARMSREKGLEKLVDAFLLLKKRDRVKNLKLRVGGSCGPADQVVVTELRKRLEEAGVAGDVDFVPNPSRAAKLDFLRTLSVFSVPATYGEAFGLYLIEALAAGVPVVQPAHSAFPEILQATGGGLLCDAHDLTAWPTRWNPCSWTPPAPAPWENAAARPWPKNSAPPTMARQVAALCAEAIALIFPLVNPRRHDYHSAMPYEFKTIRRVEFSETDMAGIMHYSNYFRFMETAEHAFFRSLGLSIFTRRRTRR